MRDVVAAAIAKAREIAFHPDHLWFVVPEGQTPEEFLEELALLKDAHGCYVWRDTMIDYERMKKTVKALTDKPK